MPTKARRVNGTDIAKAGGLLPLIGSLVESLRANNMETKETSAMLLRSLTEQAPLSEATKGEGDSRRGRRSNASLIVEAGGVAPLVDLLATSSSATAVTCALSAIANLAAGSSEYQAAIVAAGGVPRISTQLRVGDAATQAAAAAAMASISELTSTQGPFVKAGTAPSLVALLKAGGITQQVQAAQALANLATGNSEAQQVMAGCGAVQALLSLLDVGKAQATAAYALQRLAEGNAANRAAIASSDGPRKMVALLGVVHVGTQANAAAALAALASGADHVQQNAVARVGGIRPLLALVGSRYPTAQRSAITALAMLARGNTPNQDSIVEMGGLVPLLRITHLESDYSSAVRAPAVLALAEIARHNQKNQTMISSSEGAVLSLCDLLRDSKSPEVEAEVSGAIWALTEDHAANKEAFSQAIAALVGQLVLAEGRMDHAYENSSCALTSLAFDNANNLAQIIPLLVELLTEESTTQGRAAGILWRIARDNPRHELIIAKAGDMASLVRLLTCPVDDVKAYALWSVSHSIDDSNQKIVAAEGGIAPLVTWLSATDELTREQAARALRYLALDNYETQRAITLQGAADAFISLLSADRGGDLLHHAVAALSALAENPLNTHTIYNAGAIEPLVSVLCDPHCGTGPLRHAASAVARLALEFDDEQQEGGTGVSEKWDRGEHHPARKEPVTNLIRAKAIAQAGAIPSLVEMLRGSHGSDAQKEAAKALWVLADFEDNRSVIADSDGIAPLVELLDAQDIAARRHAEGTLVRLSREGPTRAVIVERLVSMLNDSSGVSSQEQASAAMANLAQDVPDSRSTIIDAGAIPLLIALLNNKAVENAMPGKMAGEHALSALAHLAHGNPKIQAIIGAESGIPALIAKLQSASANTKDTSLMNMWTLALRAIWHVAEGNRDNQTKIVKAGAVQPIVNLLGSANMVLRSTAAGTCAVLARGHADNQAALARGGAIPLLAALAKESVTATGALQAMEESAAALWALASDGTTNVKAIISKSGGVAILVGMLENGTSEKSFTNAAGALAAMADRSAENLKNISHALIAALSSRQSAARASRLLAAVATLCGNGNVSQTAVVSVEGAIMGLTGWLANSADDVQIQGTRALLALVSNNSTSQDKIGSGGAIPYLIKLIDTRFESPPDAQQFAASALWHLASLPVNRALIATPHGTAALVGMLSSPASIAGQLGAMISFRLAKHSAEMVAILVEAGIIPTLVQLLQSGNPAAQQMAAATIAAIGEVTASCEAIMQAGAIVPLIRLLTSLDLGTPEAAARALANLARVDMGAQGCTNVRSPSYGQSSAASSSHHDSDACEEATSVTAAKQRRKQICEAHCKGLSGIEWLIAMLDGSNLALGAKVGAHTPSTESKGDCAPMMASSEVIVARSASMRTMPIQAHTREIASIFTGSQADFGVGIGMQEQAVAAMVEMAHNDFEVQRAIVEANGLPRLLALIAPTRSDRGEAVASQLSQENTARVLLHLSGNPSIQHAIVRIGVIPGLVALLKAGTPQAQMLAAATLSQLAGGYATVTASLRNTTDGITEEINTFTSIAEAQGIAPLIRICGTGTLVEAKEFAALALWHIALDPELRTWIGANGGINPLAHLLAKGTSSAQAHASLCFRRLAIDNPESQVMIAKCLVGMLEHDDDCEVLRAVSNLFSLAADNPEACSSIVYSGAVPSLVRVLTRDSDNTRGEAAKVLQILADSSSEQRQSIASSLVAVKVSASFTSEQAQEAVTALLLALSPTGEEHRESRLAIANTSPHTFRVLIRELQSDSITLRTLAVALLARLVGDSRGNVEAIADANGIKPLVELLKHAEDDTTEEYAALVIARIAAASHKYADMVASEGGIPLSVKLLATGSTAARAQAAEALKSLAVSHATEVVEEGWHGKSAVEYMVSLLSSADTEAQERAAHALAGIAAGGKKDVIMSAGGVELLIGLLRLPARTDTLLDTSKARSLMQQETSQLTWEDADSNERVRARAADALSELANDSADAQAAIIACSGIEAFIHVVEHSAHNPAKACAASAIWRLSSQHHEHVVNAGAIAPLVLLAGSSNDDGQTQSAGALITLACGHPEHQAAIAELLVSQLNDLNDTTNMLPQHPGTAVKKGDGTDKQARAIQAISRFAQAHTDNQDALARAGGIELLLSLLHPNEDVPPSLNRRNSFSHLLSVTVTAASGKSLVRKELAAALWSTAHEHPANRRRIAELGGIPLLIALLGDHMDVRRDAAGALGSLCVDPKNQQHILESGGIPKLLAQLECAGAPESITRVPQSYVAALETAVSALHSLTGHPGSRIQIVSAGGISHLSPILFLKGTSSDTRHKVSAALIALMQGGGSEQTIAVISLLIKQLETVSLDANDVGVPIALDCMYSLCLDLQNREALVKTDLIPELTRQLTNSSDAAITIAEKALTLMAHLSPILRVRVIQEAATLLRHKDEGVRRRSLNLLNGQSELWRACSRQQQREAVLAGGISPLVDLIMNVSFIEAHEYALWCLSMVSDADRRRQMVNTGCVAALIAALEPNALISVHAQEHAASLLSMLAIDGDHNEHLIKSIPALVAVLSLGRSVVMKHHAAAALARLAGFNSQIAFMISKAGVMKPLVEWLCSGDNAQDTSPKAQGCDESDEQFRMEFQDGISLRVVAATALSDLVRGNSEMRWSATEDGAVQPLVDMLKPGTGSDAQKVACIALATLGESSEDIQATISHAGACPLLVNLLRASLLCEHAAHTIAELSKSANNKLQFAQAKAVPPLVALLSSGNPATQQSAAKALGRLTTDCTPNQATFAQQNAAGPLATLLGSDMLDTQEASKTALLQLAVHDSESRSAVIRRLVDILMSRNTSAQLHATEALVTLLERCPQARDMICKAGAISPLVTLLGNGQRADKNTPPERAACALAELVRLNQGKIDVGRKEGLPPLVLMLTSTCDEARTHAASALWHLSVIAEHKSKIIAIGGVQHLVKIMARGPVGAQRFAAGALWQLASSTEAKKLMVESDGIPAMVWCLCSIASGEFGVDDTSNVPAQEVTLEAKIAGSGDTAHTSVDALTGPSTAAIAVVATLALLARDSSTNRSSIVESGGLAPVADLLNHGSTSLKQHATSTLWALAQEPLLRAQIIDQPFVVSHLAELLRSVSGSETQKLAAGTLVCLAQDEQARKRMLNANGLVSTLSMLKVVADSWLQAQASELMRLLGAIDAYGDPASSYGAAKSRESRAAGGARMAQHPHGHTAEVRYHHTPRPMLEWTGTVVPMASSPRHLSMASQTHARLISHTGTGAALLARFQAKLADDPHHVWMIKGKKDGLATNNHMADFAIKFQPKDKVTVETADGRGVRKAIIEFVGKVPEIAPGFWIGVQFEYPDGKNDGSIKGTRYFTCPQDHGSFLRPNRVKPDGVKRPLPEDQNDIAKEKPKDKPTVAGKQERMRAMGSSEGGDKAADQAFPSPRTAAPQQSHRRTPSMPVKGSGNDSVVQMRQSAMSARIRPTGAQVMPAGSTIDPAIASSPRGQRSQLRDAVEVGQPARRSTRKSSKALAPAPESKATAAERANTMLASRAVTEPAVTFFANAEIAPATAGSGTNDRRTTETKVAVAKVAVTAAAKATAALARDSASPNPALFPSVLGLSPTQLVTGKEPATAASALAALHAQRSQLREAVETQAPQRRSRRMPQAA